MRVIKSLLKGKSIIARHEPIQLHPWDHPGIGKIVVNWYCGGYSERGRYLGQEGELPECGNEFTTVEDIEDWLEDHCSTECPDCGRVLLQNPDASSCCH